MIEAAGSSAASTATCTCPHSAQRSTRNVPDETIGAVHHDEPVIAA